MDRWKQGPEWKGRMSVSGLQQLQSRLTGQEVATQINVLLRHARREGSVPGACAGEAGDLMLSLRSH